MNLKFLMIILEQIKNQSQHNRERETAKISALLRKELDNYEYLTGEDLAFKPEVVQKIKLEYSPLGEALSNEGKSKADTGDKVVNINKQDKNLFYISQHSFVKFKDISDFKELSLDSMQKS